jgi:hypothetical protein
MAAAPEQVYIGRMIQVEHIDKDTFSVTVDEGETASKHEVELDDGYFESLTGGEGTKEELIKRSFEFLLEREPKETIMSRFHLSIIPQYFPEYEAEVG